VNVSGRTGKHAGRRYANEVIGTYVTIRTHLKFYSYLEALKERVIYFDTVP
jgi:hypothetical protein